MPLADPTALHPQVLAVGTVNRCLVQLSVATSIPTSRRARAPKPTTSTHPKTGACGWVPYLYPGAPERLVIGRYGQIAHGARFVTASANHALGGITTYPFETFDPAAIGAYKRRARGCRTRRRAPTRGSGTGR